MRNHAAGLVLARGVLKILLAAAKAELDLIGHAQGAVAMNPVNSTILGSLFMPLFFGTTIAAALLAMLALLGWGEPGAVVMLAGMFISVVYNVPPNNELARAGTGSAEVWARYLKDWTFWNHVRTLASAAAMALFIAAIALGGA